MPHDAPMNVSLVNPAQARDFAGALAVRSKTDGIDSYVLARYGRALKPPLWHPAPVHARQLHALLARREALVKDLLRERLDAGKSKMPRSALARLCFGVLKTRSPDRPDYA